MYVSIRANIRTASAARSSLNGALQAALRGGAVTGLVVVALSLLGVGALFFCFGGLDHPQQVPYQLVGFGFGASLVALFAQLGGGIYTKAADVGADLVGKVEAGIPEDDPRNPAVIADLVGDNVGDCAGRGADIFESTAAENVGAMILGAALYPVFGIKGILFPLIVHAINLIASIIGVAIVKTNDTEDPMRALNRGFYVTSLLALVRLRRSGVRHAERHRRAVDWLLGCGVVGMATAFLFVWITQYYTESSYRPVQSIAEASLTGPATNIISGLAVGMETPALPVIVISAALLLSYYFGVQGLRTQAIGCRCNLELRQGHLRHGHRHHGHVELRGIHPGDGYLRPHHRQRRRHHRNVQPAGLRPRQDRQAGLRRQHHQGAHQGLCHRFGFAGCVPALLRLSGRGEDHRRVAHQGCHGCRHPGLHAAGLVVHQHQPCGDSGLRRRAAGRDADLTSSRRSRSRPSAAPRRWSSRTFATSSARTPASWQAPPSRTTRAASAS